MNDIAGFIHSKIITLLRKRKALVQLASRQRAKFEGWLKFELAAALQRSRSVQKVIVEGAYRMRDDDQRLSIVKCDVVADLPAGRKCFVELKTANTSWRAEGVDTVIRPVKLNVTQIIEDIKKLRRYRPRSRKAVAVLAFLFFPVSHKARTAGPLDKQLDRIEREGMLPKGTLRGVERFVRVTPHYGISVFVFPVR